MKNYIFIALLFCFSTVSTAEIVVIGNMDNEVSSLTKKQVIAIFMGRSRSLPNGVRALPLDEENLRNEFYEKLTNRSIAQIDAYWARILFSGQASTPALKKDPQTVVDEVKKAKGKIAYIDKKYFNEEQMKMLFAVD